MCGAKSQRIGFSDNTNPHAGQSTRGRGIPLVHVFASLSHDNRAACGPGVRGRVRAAHAGVLVVSISLNVPGQSRLGRACRQRVPCVGVSVSASQCLKIPGVRARARAKVITYRRTLRSGDQVVRNHPLARGRHPQLRSCWQSRTSVPHIARWRLTPVFSRTARHTSPQGTSRRGGTTSPPSRRHLG